MFPLQTIQSKVKHIVALVILLCASISSAFSQHSDFTVQGIVLDSANKSVMSFVSITLQDTLTKKSVQSTLTQEDGSFFLNSLPKNNYKLILTYLGYKPKTIQLQPTSSKSINLGQIILSPFSTLLNEVHVVTQKSLIEQEIDRLIYNVEVDPESNVLNTLDMFRKVPFLTLDAEDNLQLNGNSTYQILINGKKSALFTGNSSDIFRSLPASVIKKIEVITNPSAKYEAAGIGGIINIVTHQKGINGYEGALNLSANTPQGYAGGGYITTSVDKISISGRVNHTSSKSPVNKSNFLREDLARLNSLRQTGEGKGNSSFNNLGGELNYDLTALDHFSANFSFNRSINNNNYLQLVEQFNAKGKLTQAYHNLNQSESTGTGSDIGFDYQHNFNNNDQQQISLSVNKINSKYKNATGFILQPLLNYQGRQSITNSTDESREYTIQADYVQPLGKHTMELGIKSILQKNASNYFYKIHNSTLNLFVIDTSLSNTFNYKQDVHAAYLSVNLKRNNWGIRAGSRIEAASLKANFETHGTAISQGYLNLLPNLTLSRLLKGNSTIRLSYSQRINRPNLYFLNPYKDLTDPLNISFGNPALAPALNHQLQLDYNSLIKNIFINAAISHSFSNSSIEQFTTLGSDSIARTTFGNLGRNQNYSFLLSGSTTLAKKLNLNITATTSYIMFTSTIEQKTQINNGFTYTMRCSGSYRFIKGFRASGNISYNSPNIILQGKTGGYTWSSLSVSKEFLKDNKANVSLSVRSPFQRYRQTFNETKSPDFYQIQESEAVTRQFNLSFNYRFSKLKSR